MLLPTDGAMCAQKRKQGQDEIREKASLVIFEHDNYFTKYLLNKNYKMREK